MASFLKKYFLILLFNFFISFSSFAENVDLDDKNINFITNSWLKNKSVNDLRSFGFNYSNRYAITTSGNSIQYHLAREFIVTTDEDSKLNQYQILYVVCFVTIEKTTCILP